MKIRLKLTREQYKGVATIVQNCCNALGGTDFESVQYRDCLMGMQLKMAGKMLTMGRKTTMTLTDMEALVLHNCIDESLHLYQPYEMGLGYMILAEIDQQKNTQRKNRGRLIRVALVGYTNVGKSTLMNILAKSDVFAENKLFATLDTTVRKMTIENLPFLLADTVGFIRKLPSDLVESFKSTLDEVREADLLVHVVDISHPDFEEQIRVVEQTLAELGCAEKPSMIVFNKIDAYRWTPQDEDDLTEPTRENISLDELKQTWMARMDGDCLFVSAREKQNIDTLRTKLYERVRQLHVQKYPYNDFLYTIEEDY